MADRPQGVRNNTKSTLYPSGIAAAATWGRDSWQSIIEDYTFKAGVQHEVVIEHYNRGGTNGLDMSLLLRSLSRI